MTRFLLPLLLAGTIHFWNPGGSTKGIRVETPSQTIEFDIRGYQEYLLKSDEVGGIVKVMETWFAANDFTTIRAWIEVAGVPFEAKEAKKRWVIPSDPYTGILLATDEGTQIEASLYRRDGSSSRTGLSMPAGTTNAFYTSWMFFGESEGTVVFIAKAPIYAAAARCTPECSPVPVQ